MSEDDVIFGYRLQLFDYAARSSVSEACRVFGIHRSTYYAWKRRVERHGRTELALGAAQRRAKQRRRARETLGRALASFEKYGAALWAEKARIELAAIGGRISTRGELTPTEQLAAEGRSNREIAATLYVTPKTVEFHLRHVFAKLGVGSRTQLARRLTEASKD
jgi:DNA-binding CsgD family transcriptional regulator